MSGEEPARELDGNPTHAPQLLARGQSRGRDSLPRNPAEQPQASQQVVNLVLLVWLPGIDLDPFDGDQHLSLIAKGVVVLLMVVHWLPLHCRDCVRCEVLSRRCELPLEFRERRGRWSVGSICGSGPQRGRRS